MSKSRGIPFSAPMVRALLAGNKTQTRRAVKLQPDAVHGGEPYWFIGGYRAWTYRSTSDVLRKGGDVLPCPYGQAGDRLWVREAWRADVAHDALPPREIPPGSPVFMEASALNWRGGPHDGTPGKLRPGMFMPRWASRITLQITDVRVERLQDISQAEALAEGVTPQWEPGMSGRLMEALGGFSHRPAASAYATLWEEINGAGSWESNAWVWAVGFKRIEAGA